MTTNIRIPAPGGRPSGVRVWSRVFGRERSARAAALFALLATALAASGCVDGPLGNLNAYNPLMRRQWAADEQLGTTYYQRMQHLESLLSRGSSMDAAEQKKVAAEMAQLVRSEDNHLLRAQAVRVLGEIKDPAANLGLNMATTDKDHEVRLAVCGVLGGRRDRTSLRGLARLLSSDENVDVRMAAARELGNYRDAEAYQALGDVLKDPDPAMQHRALESLRMASGRDFGQDLAAWRQFVETGDAVEPTRSWASRLTDWY